MRNLYTFQRININRKEDVQVYNSQWLRKIGKLRARRNTRIDVKNNETKGEEKEGEACSTLGNYETRDCCVAREGWGWSRVTRSLLECLRRRLITQLRGFSRMLISRNTCKTRTVRARASFPLEDPVVLEARLGDEGLDCTRRLKRDQKEAAHVAEEISTYTLLHARELVCGTRTRVQREGWRGRRGGSSHLRARPPLPRASAGRRRGKERSVPSLGDPRRVLNRPR